MSYPPAAIPRLSRPKLSDEPNFISIDLNQSKPVEIPNRSEGLLAFLYADENWESVIKILLCDDLARSFLENRPFSGRANRIAYHVFPAIKDSTVRMVELKKRLQLHTRLTENYSASSWEKPDQSAPGWVIKSAFL
jgi:hypothetical protein